LERVDEVRRRVQQELHGHRGRKGGPPYGPQTILRAEAERLTDRQAARLARAIAADDRHEEVHLANRRIARGFRYSYNYRLRMLLIGGGLTHDRLKR
jgi:hypothetical protein